MALEAKILSKVAQLARIELTESEAVTLQKEISDLLEYVDLLQDSPAIDASSAESPTTLSRRADKPLQSIGDELLDLSADYTDHFVRVPRVLPS